MSNTTTTCPRCGEDKPTAEFEYTFYCPQSQGMDSDTCDECEECRREINDEECRKALGEGAR